MLLAVPTEHGQDKLTSKHSVRATTDRLTEEVEELVARKEIIQVKIHKNFLEKKKDKNKEQKFNLNQPVSSYVPGKLGSLVVRHLL